ncbi:MAG: CoA transferase, partial [Robiginitomaculum sp.]|nr:CoA transferase [Robiginitomaculum sp.]
TRLAAAMEQSELASDKRYATHGARGENQTELDILVGEWTSTLDADDLMVALDKFGIPQGKIYRAPDMLDDPHFKARQAIIKVAHPQFKNLQMQNVVPKFSKTPGKVRWTGPELGQHNDEIYRELLGMTKGEMQKLEDGKII